MKDFSCIDYSDDGIVLEGSEGRVVIRTPADAKVVARCLHQYLVNQGIQSSVENGLLIFK